MAEEKGISAGLRVQAAAKQASTVGMSVEVRLEAGVGLFEQGVEAEAWRTAEGGIFPEALRPLATFQEVRQDRQNLKNQRQQMLCM